MKAPSAARCTGRASERMVVVLGEGMRVGETAVACSVRVRLLRMGEAARAVHQEGGWVVHQE